MLNSIVIVKALIILLYIIPGWKVLDLMWEQPIHVQGVVIKGRVQNQSTKPFMIVINTRGEIKYINVEGKELFPGEVNAVIKTLFATYNRADFLSGLEKLGLNKDIVELTRIYGNVCYMMGNENGFQLWVDKKSLLPLKVKNKDYEIVFQQYANHESWIFPTIIEISGKNMEKSSIYIDEFSLLKAAN